MQSQYVKQTAIYGRESYATISGYLSKAQAVLIEGCTDPQLKSFLEGKIKGFSEVKQSVVRPEIYGPEKFTAWCEEKFQRGLYVVVKARPTAIVPNSVSTQQPPLASGKSKEADHDFTKLIKDAWQSVNDVRLVKAYQCKITGYGIFNHMTDPANALVNCVNLQGVMGAGLALEFKKYYPENYFYSYWSNCAFNIRTEELVNQSGVESIRWAGTTVSCWHDRELKLASVVNLPTKTLINASMNENVFMDAFYGMLSNWCLGREWQRHERLIIPYGIGKGLARPKSIPNDKWNLTIDTQMWTSVLSLYWHHKRMDTRGLDYIRMKMNNIFVCDEHGNMSRLLDIMTPEKWNKDNMLYASENQLWGWEFLINDCMPVNCYGNGHKLVHHGESSSSFENMDMTQRVGLQQSDIKLRQMNHRCQAYMYEFENTQYYNTMVWSKKKHNK